MPITKRGVYHNLKESKYVVSNEDVTFFFSSEHTLNKFIDGYENYRVKERKKIEHLHGLTKSPLNFDMLHDIEWYKKSEKRGHYVWLKGVSISEDSLYHYAVRMMIEESPIWERAERPKVGVRFGRQSQAL
jgi:YHS domain-containing protein